MRLNHAILTRFNLPGPGYEGFIRATPAWLEGRFELFERYCMPSVLAQTCRNFQWLIYFDPQSPDWAKRKIAEHEAASAYRAVFRETVSKANLLDDLRMAFADADGMLLTTRFDNDDMLGRHFIEYLQNAALQAAARTVFNFPQGFTYGAGRLYRHADRSNAFASMCEPWDGAFTIWHDWHTRLKRYAPIVQIAAGPEWIQVIHGRNVSNRVRGWLVNADAAKVEFPFLVADIVPKKECELLADRLRFHLVRQPKEGMRRLAHLFTVSRTVKDALARISIKPAPQSTTLQSKERTRRL
jgi:hypothetical protein